jgi:flagellar export protein FliJ
MQRFEFRLERLLKLKQQREWMGELRQQKARLALEAVRARIEALQGELAAIARDLQGGRVAADRWPAAYAHTGRLGQTLLAAEVEAIQAERQLQEATADLIRLAQEVETLKHLRERAWVTHKDEAAASEQRRLDELGMRRWQATRANGFMARPTAEGERP